VKQVIKNNEKAKKKFGELLVESTNQVENVKLKTILKEVGWNSTEDQMKEWLLEMGVVNTKTMNFKGLQESINKVRKL